MPYVLFLKCRQRLSSGFLTLFHRGLITGVETFQEIAIRRNELNYVKQRKLRLEAFSDSRHVWAGLNAPLGEIHRKDNFLNVHLQSPCYFTCSRLRTAAFATQ